MQIDHICAHCKRRFTYNSTKPGTGLCECGFCVLSTSMDGKTTLIHYSGPYKDIIYEKGHSPRTIDLEEPVESCPENASQIG
uniref:Uncharacterized protein n=1 Tax=viral metagenome TaxID=1070528 RepID=A0A6M3KCL2_9ZZZZ